MLEFLSELKDLLERGGTSFARTNDIDDEINRVIEIDSLSKLRCILLIENEIDDEISADRLSTLKMDSVLSIASIAGYENIKDIKAIWSNLKD